jgi:hypothetical protein
MPLRGVPVCTDFTKTRREGSWTPRIYVGPGIRSNRSTSFLVDEILIDTAVAARFADVAFV